LQQPFSHIAAPAPLGGGISAAVTPPARYPSATAAVAVGQPLQYSSTTSKSPEIDPHKLKFSASGHPNFATTMPTSAIAFGGACQYTGPL
jgi:hypothetical protein